MTSVLIWLVAVAAITGVIIRPFKVPEMIWAVSGALLLILCGLIRPADGLAGVVKGTDVYLFLTGMMLLAESAREERLFDWLAAHAARLAKGSANRLFLLVYLVGVIVTSFLSNDATAVVLTPAVAAAARAARVRDPLPYLLICAFIANAASFVLPISNPANLVIYGSHLPPLSQWIHRYLVPSVVSILTTFLVLWLTQRKRLKAPVGTAIPIPVLSKGGKTALLGIVFTAVALLIASALDIPLGWPTAITGTLTAVVVALRARKNPIILVKGVSWSVLPLVAGLFVVVQALDTTGLIAVLTNLLNERVARSATGAVWESGLSVALGCNLMNNLPAGLMAGHVVQSAQHVPETIKAAILIGVDLGPNLSVTGSLATILWLVALRREGLQVSAGAFLKLGAVVMTTALVATLASLWL